MFCLNWPYLCACENVIFGVVAIWTGQVEMEYTFMRPVLELQHAAGHEI